MSDRAIATARPRAELLRRHSLRRGWGFVAIGVLLPPLALVGVRIGFMWRRAQGSGQIPLMLAGTGVFVARVALWATGVT